MTQLLPPKKDVALALLERSNVDVHLDPREEGVIVPPQFRKEPRLILKIGLNMAIRIPDLRLDDDSMSCTLSFNRTPFYCVVPWPSVFAIVGEDGRGMVWPDNVPQEVAVRVTEERRPQGQIRAVPPPPPDEAPADRESRPSASASPASVRGRARAAAAAASPAPASGGEERKKGGKRKKEERPALAAVPAAPPSERKAGERRAPKEPASSKDLEAPPPPKPSRPMEPVAAGQKPRPKRELPPYLRVVK